MKGQSSVETVALLAVLLIIFVVVFVVASSMTSVSSLQTQQLIGQRAADDIIAIADEVYLQGNGTRQDVFITFPENINRTFIDGTFFEVHVYEKGGRIQKLIAIGDVTLDGSLPNASGTYRVSIMSNGSFVYLTT